MTIQSTVIYPSSIVDLAQGRRVIQLTDLSLEQFYGGVIEGAPRPEWDARLRARHLERLRERWGERTTHVIEPEVVEIPHRGGVLRRMPNVACAAWLRSESLTDAGDGSHLVLVWWTGTVDLPVGPLVARALAGVRWERFARDFDI